MNLKVESSLFISLQISRDCQELEPSVGEQLASLLYLEPDSDLMVLEFDLDSDLPYFIKKREVYDLTLDGC